MSDWVARFMAIVTMAVLATIGRAHPDEPAQPSTMNQPETRSASWNFDKDDAGRPPSGWRIAATHAGKVLATWQVARDPAAASPPNVLSIIRTDNSGSTFNLALAERTAYQDLELAVKVRSNTGKEDQGGGPIWRCKDANNYYICRINPLESNFRVYKVVDGKRSMLEGVRVETAAGRWYALRVVMIGDQIACYLDGKKLLEARDESFREPGMIGLWTKADAGSSFDDLTAKERPKADASTPAEKKS